ncbi:MAG: hypothetical protein HZA50_16320 [Planctomycetes bacterium]|nr:hypothetical protein [Planctomycetota bacterium]
MTTSLTTFEHDFLERLLDVVYGQWHALDAPFPAAPYRNSSEVIDPEALIWCSLEFLPTQPRLREAVVGWLHIYGKNILRQRINRLAKGGDPRANIWNVLVKIARSSSALPIEPCYGLQSVDEVEDFCVKLELDYSRLAESDIHTGKPLEHASTILLQARNLLGSDLRHILLAYFLANPGGGNLRTIQHWSGYSYRSISDTALHWVAAGVLEVDRGFCHLKDPQLWRALLRLTVQDGGIPNYFIIVDWLKVFDSCIHLLRALSKVRSKGLALDSPVVDSYCRQTAQILSRAVLNEAIHKPYSVNHLQELLQQRVRAEASSAGNQPTE